MAEELDVEALLDSSLKSKELVSTCNSAGKSLISPIFASVLINNNEKKSNGSDSKEPEEQKEQEKSDSKDRDRERDRERSKRR